jgi:hypothetical protein
VGVIALLPWGGGLLKTNEDQKMTYRGQRSIFRWIV